MGEGDARRKSDVGGLSGLDRLERELGRPLMKTLGSSSEPGLGAFERTSRLRRRGERLLVVVEGASLVEILDSISTTNSFHSTFSTLLRPVLPLTLLAFTA